MQTRVASATMTGGSLPAEPPPVPARISWGAVFAGGVVAVTVGAMLNLLGLAVGATTVDPSMPGDTPTATTIGIAGGIWLLVANLIGLGVGGYVAARLSGTSDDTDGILHGLSVWAIGFMLSAVLLGNVIAGTASTAFGGISSVISGAAQGAGNAASSVAQNVTGAINPEAMVDRLRTALQTGGDPAAMTSEQRQTEIGQIVTTRVSNGEFTGGSRERLAQLIAAEYGIPPQEATTRVNQLETQATQAAQRAEETARQAAETAANAAATTAYWIFAAMLLGAVAAVLGARMGTRRAMARRYA